MIPQLSPSWNRLVGGAKREDAAGRTLVRQQIGQNLEKRALDLSTTIVNPYAVASGPLFPGQTAPGASGSSSCVPRPGRPSR